MVAGAGVVVWGAEVAAFLKVPLTGDDHAALGIHKDKDTRTRMPAYNSVMFKAAYTAAGAGPPADAAYDHIGMSGQGFIKCCYVNSRGEAGPDSEPVKFIVN